MSRSLRPLKASTPNDDFLLGMVRQNCDAVVAQQKSPQQKMTQNQFDDPPTPLVINAGSCLDKSDDSASHTEFPNPATPVMNRFQRPFSSHNDTTIRSK